MPRLLTQIRERLISMNNSVRCISALLSLLVLSVSCKTTASRSLDTASACMQERPDSALCILRAIPERDLNSLGKKAQYALLLATALDKNHIDTTDTRLLEPSFRYYRRLHNRDKLAATWFYQGRILLHSGDIDEARRAFATALDYSEGSSDHLMLMRLYAQVSALYSSDNNLEEAHSYIVKAREEAALASDSYNIWLIKAREATSLSNLERFDEADSLFGDFFRQPAPDSTVRARFLFNYAKTLLRKRPGDPEASTRAFEEAVSAGCAPNVDNACVYAMACELCGRPQDADRILRELDAAGPKGRNGGIFKLYKYRIYKHRGQTEKALQMYEAAVAVSDSIVQHTLQQSLNRTREEYLSQKAAALELRRKNTLAVSALILIVLLGAVAALLWRRRQKLSAKEEEIESLREDTRRLLMLEGGKDETISRLRDGYVSMYKRQFKLLDDLCAAYWSPSRTDKKDRIYSEVRSALNMIQGDSEGQAQLEAMIDRDLDGIMSKLRADLPGRTDDDFRFIAYLIIGLSPKTIASILDCVPGSVYNRKMRLKERLSKLDSPWRDLYLKYII